MYHEPPVEETKEIAGLGDSSEEVNAPLVDPSAENVPSVNQLPSALQHQVHPIPPVEEKTEPAVSGDLSEEASTLLHNSCVDDAPLPNGPSPRLDGSKPPLQVISDDDDNQIKAVCTQSSIVPAAQTASKQSLQEEEEHEAMSSETADKAHTEEVSPLCDPYVAPSRGRRRGYRCNDAAISSPPSA